MKQPNDAKTKAKGVPVDAAALERAEEILRRMLDAPPKPHDEMTVKKRAKKPQK
jgi:hypothetical protein